MERRVVLVGDAMGLLATLSSFFTFSFLGPALARFIFSSFLGLKLSLFTVSSFLVAFCLWVLRF
ncbi:hypothetical protein HanXRQr2_Chr12g0524451 [Helianthus annuus]|uniref:Uncharacterized protein n=1 Tax=Helianthus annuus TaxID=4232 RepID=A0A9K3ENU5_HELAN|nr:hypothetical protein HanXRQr2_Chr12g0524451 [Helianthus annuus]KAJ0861320.1 hypothetical protein HanPSC8_Chr12g0505361 [Helianthus annuus]